MVEYCALGMFAASELEEVVKVQGIMDKESDLGILKNKQCMKAVFRASLDFPK